MSVLIPAALFVIAVFIWAIIARCFLSFFFPNARAQEWNKADIVRRGLNRAESTAKTLSRPPMWLVKHKAFRFFVLSSETNPEGTRTWKTPATMIALSAVFAGLVGGFAVTAFIAGALFGVVLYAISELLSGGRGLTFDLRPVLVITGLTVASMGLAGLA
jgi:hypothetical protein